ncbi:MAG: DUF485 domain-containing protein [Deltaproteobacteria bacterium]|nr:DUF485 domain-containing protein [Deltaproteobacteria bacterium]
MSHGPAVKLGKDNASPAKTRLGLILFFVYSMIYAGFVAINTLDPAMMGKQIVGGLNLAVIYGFALILLAIVMGLVYNRICTSYENKLNTAEEMAALGEDGALRKQKEAEGKTSSASDGQKDKDDEKDEVKS